MDDPSTRPPIWVLSLESAVARRKKIAVRLARLDLAFEIVPAIDAGDLGDSEIAQSYDPYRAVAHTGGPLAIGQLATALSHLAIYRRMVDENLAEVLVLEDDAVPTTDMVAIVTARDRFPRNWEIMLLYHGPGRSRLWRRVRLERGYRVVRFPSFVDGAVAYLIRQAAARKLLAAGYPVWVPADYLLGGWVLTGARLYGIEPNCVHHDAGPSMRATALVGADVDLRAAQREFARRYPPRSRLWIRCRDLLRTIDPRDPGD